MAITSQATYFLNAYYILERAEKDLQALRERRAQEHNLQNPDKLVVEIGHAEDQQTGNVNFVCLAFAVELYVKAVFEVLGTNQRGHNIRELFKKLPEDVQKRIFKIHMPNSYGATLESYKEKMDIISKGFEEFRYSYEHQSLTYHRGFALKMIDAMKQVINEERAKKTPGRL